MNLLLDGLPEEVEVLGQRLRINTDFRTGIIFEEMMTDRSLTELEKLQTALALYFPGVQFGYDAIDEAINQVLWFYRCGSAFQRGTTEDGQEPDGDDSETAFSYEHDADYIYAAFMQAYGLDLPQATLHWWQFRALFRSLPEDTQFVNIVGYRTLKIPAKMPKEQRQHYEKMKRLYALPQSADRQQLESDLNSLLLNGGDPTALLAGGQGHARRHSEI